MGRPVKPRTAFGERLIKARGNRTREDVAAELGCAPSSLGNYERGRTEPSIEVLERLRAVLGVSLDWLIAGPAHSGGAAENKTNAEPDPEVLRAAIQAVDEMLEQQRLQASASDRADLILSVYRIRMAERASERHQQPFSAEKRRTGS